MSDILARDNAAGGTGAFTAGRLHDIGIAVLDQYFPAMFSKIQACMNERSLSDHEAEQFLYGFDHGDIGYWLSERWNLPINLSEAIRYHHNPALANGAPQLARLVHVADILTNEFMKTKAEELSSLETGDVQEVFPPDKKEEVFRELEKRIKDSTFMNIFV